MRLNEREILGGTVKAGNNDAPVLLMERDDKIVVGKGLNTYTRFEISAASARIMARNLQRLARRIEARVAASAIEARRAATAQTGAVHESATAESGDAR